MRHCEKHILRETLQYKETEKRVMFKLVYRCMTNKALQHANPLHVPTSCPSVLKNLPLPPASLLKRWMGLHQSCRILAVLHFCFMIVRPYHFLWSARIDSDLQAMGYFLWERDVCMKACLSHPVMKKRITDDTQQTEVSHWILEHRTIGAEECHKTFPSVRNTHGKILKDKGSVVT